MFETSDTSPIEGVELGDFVRARARLEHAPDDMAAVVTMLELPDAEAWRRVDQTWRARLETDKRLARVVDEFVEDHVRELRGDADDGQDGEAETHASREAPSAPLVQQVPSYMQPGVAAPAPAPLPPAPVVAPRVSPGSPLAMETAPLDLNLLRKLVQEGPTPFAGKTSPERLKKLRDETIESDETQLGQPVGRPEEADETVMFQPNAAQRAEFQTLPFEGGTGQAVFPEMNVDAYAAFVAQLEVHDDHATILLKQGIATPKALLALRAEQERRFAQDPARRARFEERKAHFRSFMKPTR